MPSSTVFQNLAARAKAHHESINAAYEVYYSGGVSPSATPRPSMDSSARQQSTSSTPSSERSSSVSKAWQSVKKAAKEHHESVNAAYATYYSGGVSPSPSKNNSAVATPRASVESVRNEQEVQKEESGMGKAWGKVKQAAKEHHRSVNAAYGTYYGAGIN
jgi:hypothetical protein